MNRRFSSRSNGREDLLTETERNLAEERRRLLQERAEREGERRRGREETKALRHNFVNLLTLAQYEHDRALFEADEAIARLTFNEKISKRSYTNFQYLRNFNFSQKARYTTLLKLIKSNFTGMEFSIRSENVFDCRPYNGPKTPPTPNSKLPYSKTQNFQQKPKLLTNCSTSFWSIEDMLFYLKKYKNEFKEYSESIDYENVKNTDPSQLNLFPKPKILINKKATNNDSEFYNDLIEKHKKSLELIDNVGIQFSQSIPSTIIKQSENDLKNDPNTNFSFDINNIRNQLYENYFHYLLKNPMILNEGHLAQFNANLTNSSNDQNESTTSSNIISKVCNDINSSNDATNGISSTSNIQIDNVDVPDDTQIIQLQGDFINNNIKESIEIIDVYEDGEIIDSGDELTNKKNGKIKIKSNKKKLKKEEKKIEKKPKIIYKIDKSKLKSLVTNKQRKIIIYPKPIVHYPRIKYSRIESERIHDTMYEENRNVDIEESPRYNERFTNYYSRYDKNKMYKGNVYEGRQYSYESRYKYFDHSYYGGKNRYPYFGSTFH